MCFFQTVIMRSSQPLTGPNGRRCKDDERMVNAVLGIGKRGYIVDTRSSTVAKMAQAKGGCLYLLTFIVNLNPFMTAQELTLMVG